MRISDWSSDVCSSDLKLLIVDELGYLPFETNAAHLFFQLVSRRYERGSMLVTSNRSVGEWGSVFGDAVVATAILDRLLHHSHVITIRRSEEHTSELQSLMRISYAVFCLKKKTNYSNRT